MSQRLIYRCPPPTIWVKDAAQILVVDRETGCSWTLRGTEAVIWDLLTVGYPYHRVVPMLSLILSLSAEEVEEMLGGVLRRWRDASIVLVAEEANDGESDRQRGV